MWLDVDTVYGMTNAEAGLNDLDTTLVDRGDDTVEAVVRIIVGSWTWELDMCRICTGCCCSCEDRAEVAKVPQRG